MRFKLRLTVNDGEFVDSWDIIPRENLRLNSEFLPEYNINSKHDTMQLINDIQRMVNATMKVNGYGLE